MQLPWDTAGRLSIPRSAHLPSISAVSASHIRTRAVEEIDRDTGLRIYFQEQRPEQHEARSPSTMARRGRDASGNLSRVVLERIPGLTRRVSARLLTLLSRGVRTRIRRILVARTSLAWDRTQEPGRWSPAVPPRFPEPETSPCSRSDFPSHDDHPTNRRPQTRRPMVERPRRPELLSAFSSRRSI